MYLLIIGPPGAGKGTQAAGISRHYDIPAISTGDMFRNHIAEGTQLGRAIEKDMSAGKLVSDYITDAIVKDRIGRDDALDGFLLDGYPRNEHQVGVMDRLLGTRGKRLDAVLELTADNDELIRRLLNRAQVEGRADDTEEVIRHRQELYRQATAPILEIYADRGLLVKVDGLGEIDDVAQRIITAIDEKLAAK